MWPRRWFFLCRGRSYVNGKLTERRKAFEEKAYPRTINAWAEIH